MSIPKFTTLLIAVFLASACAERDQEPSGAPGGKADALECAGASADDMGLCHGSDGQFVPDECCDRERIEQLADVFAAQHAVRMPALGEDHNANTLVVEASVVESLDVDAEGVREVMMPRIDALANDMADFAAIDGNDGTGMAQILGITMANMEMSYGWNNREIRDYLIEIANDGSRPAVEGILDGFSAHFGRYLQYDLGAEFFAQELIVVRPFDHDKAFVLSLRYSDS